MDARRAGPAQMMYAPVALYLVGRIDRPHDHPESADSYPRIRGVIGIGIASRRWRGQNREPVCPRLIW